MAVNNLFFKYLGEGASANVQNLVFPQPWVVRNHPPYRPLSIPQDIGHQLISLHGNPSVWWVGQFTHYLMRPQPWLEKVLDTVEKEYRFQLPCAG